MENTRENKETFFAQYFNQKVLRTKRPGINNLKVTGFNITAGGEKDDYLELTPLSDISDEDAIEVYTNYVGGLHPVKAEWLKSIIDTTEENDMPTLLIDNLRRKGYAVSFCGLTVEDQITNGWVKLKTTI